MRDFTGGYARTTVQQNLVLRWVRDEALYDVWQRLAELGLGDAGADEITDVVSCPGTDSCKLGITSSMGLNQAIQERVEAMDDHRPARPRAIHIKMSGCPNGCSQHHIANIGFYGASIKVGEHTIPAYIAAHRRPLRGRRGRYRHAPEGAPARQARARGGRALDPARTRPSARTARSSTPSPTASAPTRVRGPRSSDLALPVEFGLETMNMFIDWNRSGPFEVDPRRGRVRGLTVSLSAGPASVLHRPDPHAQELVMTHNTGNADRMVRVVLAIVFAVAGIALGGTLGIVFFVLAAVMLVTAAVGFCPLYRLVGVNTCKVKGAGAA